MHEAVAVDPGSPQLYLTKNRTDDSRLYFSSQRGTAGSPENGMIYEVAGDF